MSNFSGYKTTAFKETQKFFVLDPATGSPSFVQGSDLVSYITPMLNYVMADSTRLAAENTDYDVGTLVQTSGATSPGDNFAATYLVVEGGSGDFPMLNGNDLLIIKGDEFLREQLAQNTVGDGSDLVAHTGTSDTVTEALDKRTIFVGSVAELEALALPAGYNVYLTESGREGEGRIRAGSHPADPRKGLFIDIANGNHWERIVEDNQITIDMFGYDGVDDTAAVSAAFKAHKDYGYKVLGKAQSNYVLTSEVTFTDIDFDGQGCTFDIASSAPIGLRSSLGWVSDSVVAAENSLVLQTSLSADFSEGGLTGNQITLTSVTGILPGHMISVVTDDVFGPSIPLLYKRGITSVVEKVVGSVVYLQHSIPFDLTAAGSRVVVFVPNKVHFKNAKFVGSDVTDDQFGLIIDGGLQPVLENLEFDVFGETAALARHCVDISVTNMKTGRAWWSDSVLTNYGLKISACNGANIRGLNTFTGRHGFSTGTTSRGLPIDTSTDTRGCPEMGVRITQSRIYPELGTTTAGGGNLNGLDCHGSTKDIFVTDSEIYRFQVEVDNAVFQDCVMKGIQFSSSFVGLRPLENGYTSVSFVNCVCDAQRMAFIGAGSGYTDPIGLTNLSFINCGLGFDFEVLLEAEVRTMNPGSIINNITVDNSERIRFSAQDVTNLKVEHLNFFNLREANRQHYADSDAPLGSVEVLTYRDCTLDPTFTAIFAQMANKVNISNVSYGVDGDSVFRILFSNASDVFVVNTRMNFGATSTNSVSVNDDGGGGSWYTINSPVLFNGGGSDPLAQGFATSTQL